MVHCRLCAGLSINVLVELARKEFAGRDMPQWAFYQHHNSIQDLESSADRGCDFCILIVECFKGTPVDANSWPRWPPRWTGTACKPEDSMFASAKELPVSDIKICINSSHIYASDTIDQVQVFDHLLVHVGPIAAHDEVSDSASFEQDGLDWDWDPLILTLTCTRGMLASNQNLVNCPLTVI